MSRYEGRETVRELWSRGVGSLGMIVIGHGGRRRGGIRHILERVETERIVCTPYAAAIRGDIVEAAAALDVGICTVSRGDTVRCGACIIGIGEPFYPPRGGGRVAEEETRLRCRVLVELGRGREERDPIDLPPGDASGARGRRH